MIDNKLAEKRLDNDMKNNYITSMTFLVASNLNAVYQHYENNSGLSFNEIFQTSKDTFNLKIEEEKYLFGLIEKVLNDKYKLKIRTKNKDEKITFEKV